MNAPKSGLFAFILFISFVLHATLLMTSTLYHLDQTRLTSGEQLINQLRDDSLSDLADSNTVSLALIANRYAHLPNVASIRILNPQNEQLVSTGENKTRAYDRLLRDVKVNDATIGKIELSLIKNSPSEVLHHIWWTLLISFLIHIMLWALYLIIIRPRRSEYVQHLVEKQTMQRKIEQLTTALNDEQETVRLLKEQYEIPDEENKKPEIHQKAIALRIAFFDPDHLLPALSPVISQRYFELYQTMLERSIELSCKHYSIEKDEIKLLNHFNQTGISMTISSQLQHAAACLFMINSLSQSIFSTIYDTYRHAEPKHFALETYSAIAMHVDSLQLNAVEAAEYLLQWTPAQTTALYLKSDVNDEISSLCHYILFPVTTNSLTRQSYLVSNLQVDLANTIERYRTQILNG